MRTACVYFLLILTSGCQNASFQENLSTVPSNSSSTDAELAARLQASLKTFNANSSEEQVRSLLEQIETLHERSEDNLSAQIANTLLSARLKVFLLKGEQQSEVEKFSLLLSKEFAGHAVGLDATVVHYVVTRDLNTALELRDFKELRATAHSIPSDNDKAKFYSTIVRRLHANEQTNSAKLALDMGMAHLKGKSGWSELFNEQFALGFKRNPTPSFIGGAFERKQKKNGIDATAALLREYALKGEKLKRKTLKQIDKNNGATVITIKSTRGPNGRYGRSVSKTIYRPK